MQITNRTAIAPFHVSDWNIGIVVAEFNAEITSALLAGAMARAAEYGITPERITIVRVAGAVEIPLALQALARRGDIDALLAIGCVINGDTPHFDYVCKFVTEGILRVQLDESIAIGFGVLTCATLKQAQDRAHLGGEHLDAALQLAKAVKALA